MESHLSSRSFCGRIRIEFWFHCGSIEGDEKFLCVIKDDATKGISISSRIDKVSSPQIVRKQQFSCGVCWLQGCSIFVPLNLLFLSLTITKTRPSWCCLGNCLLSVSARGASSCQTSSKTYSKVITNGNSDCVSEIIHAVDDDDADLKFISRARINFTKFGKIEFRYENFFTSSLNFGLQLKIPNQPFCRSHGTVKNEREV